MSVSPLTFSWANDSKLLLPDEYLKAQFTLFSSILSSKQSTENKRLRINKILESEFNYELIAKLTVGRQFWNQASLADQRQFVDVFRQYLLDKYLNNMIAYSNAQLDFGYPVIDRSKAVVQVTATLNDEIMDLEFKLYRQSSNWIIYDVEIEGVSIVRSFRAQFRSVLDKKGLPGVTAAITKRLKSTVK